MGYSKEIETGVQAYFFRTGSKKGRSSVYYKILNVIISNVLNRTSFSGEPPFRRTSFSGSTVTRGNLKKKGNLQLQLKMVTYII